MKVVQKEIVTTVLARIVLVQIVIVNLIVNSSEFGVAKFVSRIIKDFSIQFRNYSEPLEVTY